MTDISNQQRCSSLKSRRGWATEILIYSVALAILFLLSGVHSAFAFYTWIDDNGQLHVADYPKPQKPAPDSSADQDKNKTEPETPASSVKTGQPAAVGEKTPVQPAPSGSAPLPIKTEQTNTQTPSSQALLKTVSSPASSALTMPTVSAPAGVPSTPQAAPAPRMVQPASKPGFDATALMAGLGSLFLIFVFLVYLYSCLCLYLIAKKLNLSGTWMAWVPILQVFTFIACAGKPAWWFLLLLVPIVNFFITIYLWMCITETLGREQWFALLTLVPVVNLIYIGVLAFSKEGGEVSSASL
jgi:hypothetical protein